MNPFAPYVIQDVMDEASGNSEERLWHLHESLFKKSEDHKVNPANLQKTSAQMFSVYKYYENP